MDKLPQVFFTHAVQAPLLVRTAAELEPLDLVSEEREAMVEQFVRNVPAMWLLPVDSSSFALELPAPGFTIRRTYGLSIAAPYIRLVFSKWGKGDRFHRQMDDGRWSSPSDHNRLWPEFHHYADLRRRHEHRGWHRVPRTGNPPNKLDLDLRAPMPKR